MQQEFKKTILLVEDVAIIAMAEANTLKHNGFDVLIAYNGNEAVKHASGNSNIDLILMDIDLGKGMDGTEAAQIILKDQEIPIVFLSNHTEKEIVEKTEKITSYGYVVKNSGETVLLASIKMAFKLFEAHQQMCESEMKLIESDRKFHTLEKQIDDVIWTMDMNFRYTYVSPSVEKLNGYTVDEMMKLNLQDYLSEESSQKIIDLLAEEISLYLKNKVEDKIVTIELEQIKKDRTIFLTEIKARFLLDKENKPIGIIGVTRDITQRLLSEKALRDSEKALNLALEGAQIGLWDQNFNTGIVNRSDHWATMLGYDPDEIKNDLDFWKSNIHPDDLDKTLELAERHERGLSEFYKVQHRLKCRNGNYKWVLNWGKISERDSDGQPVRALGIHVDIDDNIKAEEALRKSEYQFRTLFETITLGIVYQDKDGKIISANSAAQEILGLTLDQMQGKSSLDPNWKSIHEDGSDFPGDTHPAMVAIKTGKTVANVTMGIFHPRKQKNIWIKISAVPLFQNGDKQPFQVYATFEDITERKESEEALIKSENKLRSIFKAAPVGIGVTSNRVLLEVNDIMCKMLGYNGDELIGNSALMLYPTVEEFEFVGKEKYKQIEKFGTGTVETRWKRKDGSLIDVLLSSTPLNLKDNSGGVTFTVLDITERKKIENQLRISEERYFLAQKAANIGSWDWNMLTDELSWSELVIPIFGLKPGEFKGTISEFWNRLHPDDIPMIEKKIKATIEKNEDYRVEHRVIHPDKTIRWVLETGNVFKDIDGKPYRMLGMVQDITERKHAEENLKQSEENYRRFFEEDLSGVFLSTPEGGIKTCNQAYANMMEYNGTNELIHSNPVSHYPQSQHRIDFLNLLRREKKLTNYEGEIVTKSGKHIQTLENVIGVFDDKDNLVEFWGYVNDITDRKKAEQILKNAAFEKEALHRELLHRVKNSFNLIKSLMYLEREKLDNKEANKILENLEMRIGTLSKMYTLLNISGISQHINLGEYLNQITKSLTESYVEDSDSIEIKSSFDKIEMSPRDASSVGLIVNEILTNSLKYAFPNNKKGNISISLKAIKGNVEIEISDNGVGVPGSFSLDDAKGMGLQLINMLTRQLSGTVTVEANNGTRFKIVFPLEQ